MLRKVVISVALVVGLLVTAVPAQAWDLIADKTGFDDVPEAAAVGLTTVRQPMLEKGRVAGQLLLHEGERPAARHVLLPTELVVRTSTAHPRVP